MPEYYVKKKAQSNGDHEVHQATGCPTPAELHNKKPLGWHQSCQSAVREAKKTYAKADGCANCCPDCHTR